MKVVCSLYSRIWAVLLVVFAFLLLISILQEQDLSELLQHPNTGSKSFIAPRWQLEKTEASLNPSSISSTPRRAKPPVTKRELFPTPAHSAPYAPDDDRSLTATQESRRKTIQDVCARFQPDVSPQRFTLKQLSSVYVEGRYRLLYCEVPKAGCSNWKRVLMVLNGTAHATLEISHFNAHDRNKLGRLETYDRASIERLLANYTKILFVREPFERLVSAFRDKLESPNPYYHRTIGRPIITKYRKNATQAALETGTGVTFPEFVQYLLDVKKPVGMDIHWERVTQLCNPCLMRHNFIGKFEYVDKEANFLLRSINAPKNLTFPNVKDRNPTEERTSAKITRQYFAQLNATERQNIYNFYYMDYLLFGYPKPFEDLV